jgi:L-rhamnonate dehydratase
MSLTFSVHPRVRPSASSPTLVREIRAFTVPRAGAGAIASAGAPEGHWIFDTPIANPSSCFQENKGSRSSWGVAALGSVVVEVELACGAVGVGLSTRGGPPACFIVERHLARFVEGQDASNIELIWEQMYRGTLPYGRKGLALHAISAVDLALWDALGRARGLPVFALLGGKTKERLPMYATTTRPDLAKKMGFKGAKVPLPYGPPDGDEGMRANIEHLRRARAAVGVDFPLMVDCYMALTVPYTVELLRRIDRDVPGGVKWVEEALPPDDYDGLAEVRKRAGATSLLATGEHEYTRHGFRLLLEKGAADVLQPDLTWVGGLTEARRIVALAAAFDVAVVPHGSSVFSYHLQFAFTNCPLAETIVLAPEADEVLPIFGNLFLDEPLPENGYISLADNPGFGVTLNPAVRATFERPFPHDPLPFEEVEALKDARAPDQEEWLARAARMPLGAPA